MLLGSPDLWFSVLAGAALFAAITALFMLVSGRRAASRAAAPRVGDDKVDLLDASRDLIFTVSPEGRILFANRSMRDALKLSPDDLAAQALGDLVHPHTRASIQAALEEAFTTGRSIPIEMVLTAPGGHTILVEGAFQAFAGGASPAALGVFHDTTEHRGAESALRESEERFRAMVENTSDGIALDHADGTVFYAGPSTEKIVGYRPEELIGRNAFEFVHPDDIPLVRERFNRILEGAGRTSRAEYRYLHKDGTWRWLEAIGSNHLHRPGLEAIVVNFRDITDRKSAEGEMRHALSLLAASLESTADGLLVVSPEGRIVTRNQRFAEMWGIPEDVLRSGEDDKALAVAVNRLEDPGAFLAKVRELYGNPEAESYDVLELKDGRVFERYSQPQRIDGKAVGRVWSFRDVTERVRAEAEARRAKSSLEQRVAERTSELEGVNKELEAFSYTVSHDLRTPLRAIDGFSRVLLEDEAERLGPEARRILETIRRNTQSMSVLIDDLLAFSRLGRTPLRTVMIDMGALARAIFEELRVGQPETRIRLVTGELPPARGDRAMIRQVVANLLSNALKFTMRRPEAIIEIGGHVSGDENIYFVKDNGAGFDPRFTDKLFGVFQRLHSLSEFEGTGVGLAIVQRIIQRHGGRVWADGEPDRGATFYFTLPARARQQPGGPPAPGGLRSHI